MFIHNSISINLNFLCTPYYWVIVTICMVILFYIFCGCFDIIVNKLLFLSVKINLSKSEEVALSKTINK